MISKEIAKSYKNNVSEFFEAINQADIKETFYYGRRIDRIGKFHNIRYDDFLDAALAILPSTIPANLRLQAKIQLLAKKTVSNSWTLIRICARVRSYIASFFYDREFALHTLLQRLAISHPSQEFENKLKAKKEKIEIEQKKLNAIIKKRLDILEVARVQYQELCILKNKYQQFPAESLVLQIKHLETTISELESENNKKLAPTQQDIQKKIKHLQQKMRLMQKKNFF